MITRDEWNMYGSMEQVLIEATPRSLTVSVSLGDNVYTLDELRLLRFRIFAVIDNRYLVLWNGQKMSNTLWHRLSVQAMYAALDLGCRAQDVSIVYNSRRERKNSGVQGITLLFGASSDNDTTEHDGN